MDINALTDRELLQHAWIQRDALTTTALEERLQERFTEVLDESEANAELLHVLNDYAVDTTENLTGLLDKARALDERVNGIGLLDVLLEFDIDDPATLKKVLQRDAQLRDVLDSLAQPLANLQALATPA